LEFDLPGLSKKDVEIDIDNNILVIKGNKELEKEHKDSRYYTRERFYGAFQRSFSLPTGIKESEIDASFKDGVLTVKIPKKEASHMKTIQIK
jgi:HSP20 family protein